MKYRKLAAVSAATLVVVGGGFGLAFAAIPATDGTIHGCRSVGGLNDGDLYVIDDSESCPSGTESLDWAQQGSPGVSGYEIVTDSYTTTSGSQTGAGVTVDCPAGKVAFGGGGQGAQFLVASKPVITGSEATGWTVDVVKSPSNGGTFTVTAWVVCGAVQ